MRFLAIGALCLVAFSAPAQARHHRAVQAQCVGIFGPYPCQSNFFQAQRSVEAVKRVSSRRERRGRVLVATAPASTFFNEQPSYNPAQAVQRAARTAAEIIGGRPAGCPYAYCGCYVSLHIFGKIIPSLNLAANWGRFPSASAAPGMVAYRNHHVFYIESVNSDGTVVARDGNSGRHLTRIHTVSLRGYRVVNPHGGNV